MINYTTAAEAAKLIKSNDSVYIQGSVSIPEVLVKAMADRGHELRGVKVYSAFAIGREEAPYCKPEYKDSFLVYSLFVSNSVRNWIAQGVRTGHPGFSGRDPGAFPQGDHPDRRSAAELFAPQCGRLLQLRHLGRPRGFGRRMCEGRYRPDQPPRAVLLRRCADPRLETHGRRRSR